MQDALQKLGTFISVRNLQTRGGGWSGNQFKITFSNGIVFQSYDSFCAARIDGKWYFRDGYHDYSNTTSRYLGSLCGYGVQERRKMMNDGSAVTIV